MCLYIICVYICWMDAADRAPMPDLYTCCDTHACMHACIAWHDVT